MMVSPNTGVFLAANQLAGEHHGPDPNRRAEHLELEELVSFTDFVAAFYGLGLLRRKCFLGQVAKLTLFTRCLLLGSHDRFS
jgi:hypothetical protein